MMLPQRARAAENRVKHKSSNGPPRVQSNVPMHGVFCNVRHALIVTGMSVPAKVHGNVKQGGTADKLFIRPWQKLLPGIFFMRSPA